MKNRISVAFILFVLLGTLAMPLVVAADSDKTIIKEMVQAPADYSVAVMPWDYMMHYGWRYYLNMDDYLRNQFVDWRFYRLTPPSPPPTSPQPP